jgi:hypothetical protein
MKNFEEFLKAMYNNHVSFSYYKNNGELRQATGTCLPEYMPVPKGTGYATPASNLLYFDFEAKAVRSCKIDNLQDDWKILNE